MIGKLKGLLIGACLFFGMTMTVNANPSGDEDLPSRMIMTPTIQLNVRNAPGTHGAVVGTINPGETVIAAKNYGGWFLIDYKDQGCFAWGNYLSYVSEEDGSYNEQHAGLYQGHDLYGVAGHKGNTAPTTASVDEKNLEKLDLMMKATAGVNMRETPGGKIVNVLQKGSDIHVVGNLTDIGWYKCDNNGKTVYIYDDYLIPEFPQTMKATTELNVRSTPDKSHAPVGLLHKGDKIKVSGEENGWFKYTYEKTGKICYSSAQYLTVVN